MRSKDRISDVGCRSEPVLTCRRPSSEVNPISESLPSDYRLPRTAAARAMWASAVGRCKAARRGSVTFGLGLVPGRRARFPAAVAAPRSCQGQEHRQRLVAAGRPVPAAAARTGSLDPALSRSRADRPASLRSRSSRRPNRTLATVFTSSPKGKRS